FIIRDDERHICKVLSATTSRTEKLRVYASTSFLGMYARLVMRLHVLSYDRVLLFRYVDALP
ncbi:MAG: hypothetical protein ACE5QW_01065, partial [Thermoplasmata archaeon]